MNSSYIRSKQRYAQILNVSPQKSADSTHFFSTKKKKAVFSERRLLKKSYVVAETKTLMRYPDDLSSFAKPKNQP
jgi:hypothetical protein